MCAIQINRLFSLSLNRLKSGHCAFVCFVGRVQEIVHAVCCSVFLEYAGGADGGACRSRTSNENQLKCSGKSWKVLTQLP